MAIFTWETDSESPRPSRAGSSLLPRAHKAAGHASPTNDEPVRLAHSNIGSSCRSDRSMTALRGYIREWSLFTENAATAEGL